MFFFKLSNYKIIEFFKSLKNSDKFAYGNTKELILQVATSFLFLLTMLAVLMLLVWLYY